MEKSMKKPSKSDPKGGKNDKKTFKKLDEKNIEKKRLSARTPGGP